MISLRRNSTFLLLLAFPMIAGHVAAQGFEGTITMTVVTTFGGGASGSITTASRGDRTVTTLRLLGTGAGSLAGGVLRTIIDRGANTLTTLTPMPSGIPMPPTLIGGADGKGFVTVTPLSDTSILGGTGSDTHPDIRKLGTSETVAGTSCDDYEITEQKAAPIRACITTALGMFAFPMSGRGMMGGRGSPSPLWAKAFGDKPGFPLKVWGSDGKITLEVTAIDKAPVAESAFAIPEGYVTVSGRGG